MLIEDDALLASRPDPSIQFYSLFSNSSLPHFFHMVGRCLARVLFYGLKTPTVSAIRPGQRFRKPRPQKKTAVFMNASHE